MSITREQVADLQPGDVVELGFSSGAIVRGPLVEDRHTGGLEIDEAGWSVRQGDGVLSYGLERIAATLTVVSRAPRPLYVNHPRTEPVPGDVVRDADDDESKDSFHYLATGADGIWWRQDDVMRKRDKLPSRLRLLVDGETGQVVQ